MKKMNRVIGMVMLVGVLLTNTVPMKAQELLPSGVKNTEIGERIEAFAEAHKETTAGMSVSVFDEENTYYT